MEEVTEVQEIPKTLIELLDDIEESSRFGQQADAAYRATKHIKIAKDALLYTGSIEELDAAALIISRALNNPPSRNLDYNVQMAVANAPSVSLNIDYI